jgi:hypothetical protein
MRKFSMMLAAALIAGSTSLALGQAGGGGGGAGGEGPKPGDAQPPGALKRGGIPPAAAARRGDDMAPVSQPMGMSMPKQGIHKKRSAKYSKKARGHTS